MLSLCHGICVECSPDCILAKQFVPFRSHSEVKFSKFFFNSLSLVVHKNINSCVNLGSTDRETSGCLTTNLKTVLLLHFGLGGLGL